jgi:hypothetical protein
VSFNVGDPHQRRELEARERRLVERIAQLDRQIGDKNENPNNKLLVRSRDRLTADLDSFWSLLHPIAVGSPWGDVPEREPGTQTPVVCRAPACGEYTDSRAEWERAGYCRRCYEIATGLPAPNPEGS